MKRAARRWLTWARGRPAAGSIAIGMTVRYLLALGMLALLTVAGYLVLQHAIHAQESTAAVVNVSGRQRMLSQRTALLAHQLVHAAFTNDGAERAVLRQQLIDTVDLMEKSHQGLINGDPSLGLPGEPSADVRAIYFDPPISLDWRVSNYVAEARALAATPDAELTADNRHFQYVDTHSRELLGALDTVVQQYQGESASEGASVERLELAVLAATLLVLLITALSVFRPMARRVREEMGKLEALNDTLERRVKDRTRMLSEINRELEQKITERKQAEETLRESEERYRDLFESASDLIQIVAPDGSLMYVNRAWRETLGYDEEEVPDLSLFDIIHPDSRADCSEVFQRVTDGEDVGRVEAMFQTKDGRAITVEGSCNCRFRDGKPDTVRGIFRDVTERKRAEETIRHLAYHDALTGLPNRALLHDRFTQALAQARRTKHKLAVMSLDLDRFKVVNDTAGHDLGDQLLQAVAQRLTGLVRETDTVARVGGDEFMLLLPRAGTAERAAKIAEKLLEGLRRPFHLDGQQLHTTASIGISLYPYDGEDPETLLKNADAAMYRAKEMGRDNYHIYTPALAVTVSQQLALEAGLHRALEREEFVVHYQPQADMETGRVVGAEALVRWQHPDRGLVPPGEFISLAEETGLILPLGEWVLRAACTQMRVWQEADLPPVRVAVNLSARQFQQPDLAEVVARVLEETRLEPRCLELEITESVAMQNADLTMEVLHHLREMGVRIAIDDFGTGYSSLSYLKAFPVHTLKIDRSFVRDLITDPSDAAIVTAIIAVARSLNLKVIAEGVETAHQLAFLRAQGCDEYQGYLLAKPMSSPAFETSLKRRMVLAAGSGPE